MSYLCRRSNTFIAIVFLISLTGCGVAENVRSTGLVLGSISPTKEVDNTTFISALDTETGIVDAIEAGISSSLGIPSGVRVRFAPVNEITAFGTRKAGEVIVPITVIADMAGEDGAVALRKVVRDGVASIFDSERAADSTASVAPPPAFAVPGVAPVPAAGLGSSGFFTILTYPFIAVEEAIETSRRETAEREFREGARLAALVRIGDLIAEGELAKARTLIATASDGVAPLSIIDLYLRGETARLDGDRRSARQQFLSALDLEPEFPPALRGIVAVIPPEETAERARFLVRLAEADETYAAASDQNYTDLRRILSLTRVPTDKDDEQRQNDTEPQGSPKPPSSVAVPLLQANVSEKSEKK